MPLKLWMYAALLAGVMCTFTWYTYHERGIQHTKDLAADAALANAQIVNNQKVEALAQVKANTAIDAYKAALAAAPAPDAPHVRLCPRAAAASPVPANGGPGPVADEKANDASAGPSDNGTDIGPPLDKLHEDGDAWVIALQAYVQACVDAGICKAPQ